tara:strand:+ start:265 stop:1371 length:1107 start_codon:yes stop_codon:yes gene_type:complete
MANKKTKKETVVENTSVIKEQFVETLEAPKLQQVDNTTFKDLNKEKDQTIAIRPYFNPDIENMGLENYRLNLYDGVYHEEQLTCLEVNGVKRYVTGLNEFAPEVKVLPTEKRKIKIKEIRKIVTQLEAELAQNIIDPEAPDFWNNVKLLKPDNDELWAKLSIRAGNEPIFLDPKVDPYDLIKLYAIEAGGFSIVAKNRESAKINEKVKFYLDKTIETASSRTNISKLRNKALASLQTMYDSNTVKLFYVTKLIDGMSTQYTKSTPNDIMYEMLDEYIYGSGGDRSAKKCAERFLEISRQDLGTLKVLVIIKDATEMKLLKSQRGEVMDVMSGYKLGRSQDEIYSALLDPLNETILKSLIEKVEEYWNK